MTFLNPALAFGALAFAIPLIIHILNRSRFKTIDWGAMHLLESVIKVNHKRFRLDQLILLLVRCLIPALLAFCIARPLLTSSKTMDAETPVSLLILVDASYSMDTIEQGGTRFDQALQSARQLVESASKGSDVHVIMMGSQPMPLFDQPVFDLDAVNRRLESFQGGFGSGNVTTAIQQSLQVLSGMSNPHREIVIISDFQQKDWQELIADNASNIKPLFEAAKLKPILTLLPIGKPKTENVSIESIEYPQKAIGAGEPLSFRVNILNQGPAQITNARVVFRVDGQDAGVSQVTLAPNGSTQVLFTHTFEQSGSHLVEAEVAADDALQTDNKFALSVTAWERIKVLLVDGDPDPDPLKSESDFLQIALTPFTLGRFQLADLIESETINENGLNQETINDADLIVLANVKRLTDDRTLYLSQFVENGGVLFVFPGDQIDLKWYREKMFAAGQGILPVPFGPRKSGQPQPVRIVAQRFDHPSLEFFNEPSNGDLSQAGIQHYHLLEENAELTPLEKRTEASVMARFDNTDPFLIECGFGKGIVIQMATTCDADWTDLPTKPEFLPLMQQLVTTSASRLVPKRNLFPGEPAVAVFALDTSIQTIPVKTPQGTERVIQAVEVAGQKKASFPATLRPGVYRFATDKGNIQFAVQTDRAESDSALLESKQMDDMSKLLDAHVVNSVTDYLAQDNLRRNGSEIWKYILMAFLGFLFLEIVLQQRFSRVRV